MLAGPFETIADFAASLQAEEGRPVRLQLLFDPHERDRCDDCDGSPKRSRRKETRSVSFSFECELADLFRAIISVNRQL